MSISNTPNVTFILGGTAVNVMVTAALDSGCSETLLMSENVANSIGLVKTNIQQDLTIASGEDHTFNVYLGFVTFNGVTKAIPVHTSEKLSTILAGNKFLKEFGLRVQVISDSSK